MLNLVEWILWSATKSLDWQMGLSLWEVLLARPNIVPALEEFSFVVKQRAVVVCAKGIDS